MSISKHHCGRCYVSVAVLDGCIYAMGGYDGHVRQNTAERYTPKSNQWSLITPMNHQRSDASATTLNSQHTLQRTFDPLMRISLHFDFHFMRKILVMC